MGKKTKSGIPSTVIIVGFILVVLFFEFDIFNKSKQQSTASNSTPTESNKPPAAQANKTYYALNAKDNSWPPSNSASIVAPNLLSQNFYIVLDGSGSMGGSECVGTGNKMAVAKTALNQFVQQIAASANVGLYAFDHAGSKERLPLGKYGPEQIAQAINSVQFGGGTPLSTAIKMAYDALTAKAAEQLGYGEYHLVVVTDGEANAGFDPRPVVQTVLQNSPVVVHTIGFCIRGNHSLNQEGLTVYKAANDPASLNKGLSDVLAEAPSFNLQSFDGQ